MIEALAPLFEHHSKKLMIFPILLMIVSVIFLIGFRAQTGEFFQKDVSLSGGMTVTLYTQDPIDRANLEVALNKVFSQVSVRGLSEFGTQKDIGVVIETSDINEELMSEVIKSSTGIEINEDNSSIEVVGSSLGESFYNQMLRSLIFAFLFMAVTIFITFRTIWPSLAVVTVAFGDMVVTVAILNLLNVQISSAGIAALLLLIGYSIDTDILLTTRLIKKRDGSVVEGVISSMKTGLTMTITTLAAMTVAYFVSSSLVLKQMFMIIFIGLIVDVVLTYLLNAPMLKLYVERKVAK